MCPSPSKSALSERRRRASLGVITAFRDPPDAPLRTLELPQRAREAPPCPQLLGVPGREDPSYPAPLTSRSLTSSPLPRR